MTLDERIAAAWYRSLDHDWWRRTLLVLFFVPVTLVGMGIAAAKCARDEFFEARALW